MQIEYPSEWDDLSKNERNKKIRKLKKAKLQKNKSLHRVIRVSVLGILILVVLGGLFLASRKSPEQLEFNKEVEQVSLEGMVEEFEIEGREHVPPGSGVVYATNPPTSGGHLAHAEGWGIYKEAIDDEAAVHSLEHGGIWITYKDIEKTVIDELEDLGRRNPQSVIVSPRPANDDQIVIVSWGRMMKLDSVDSVLIQKYIDTYKNQSPEKLAR